MTHGETTIDPEVKWITFLLQQKLNTRQEAMSVSIFRFVLITTAMISTPGPQCSLLWPGRVVSIPALNIYFVRIFLGICAWTNHYHKHNIIRIRTRLCILKWVKG